MPASLRTVLANLTSTFAGAKLLLKRMIGPGAEREGTWNQVAMEQEIARIHPLPTQWFGALRTGMPAGTSFRSEFEDQGFLLVPRFIQKNLLETLRKEADRLLADSPERGGVRNGLSKSADLSELDLMDIYRDIAPGLALYRAGKRQEAESHWRFWFANHWGEHATSALRVS